jgi:alpha-mannosidase
MTAFDDNMARVALTLTQRLQRLLTRIGELELWRDRAWEDLPGWRFEGAPIPLGEAWPRRDGVVRLDHSGVKVPEAWTLEETRLELALGGEGLLRIDDGAPGTPEFGLDLFHRRFPVRSRCFRLSVDIVARLPFGRPQSEPRLETARVVWADPELGRLIRRLRLIANTGAAMATDDAAALLVTAAERVLTCLSWPSETDAYLGRAARHRDLRVIWSPPPAPDRPEPLPVYAQESVAAANAALDAELDWIRSRHPRHGRLAVAGHAHIDLAWLWPIEETQRKVQRTFSTAADLLCRYPEMTFVQSSAELYELAREAEPALFERVRVLAAAGRWEPVGGMWVEPDTNMVAGEAMVRQLLYGQRWFERELGGRHRMGFLPDCFGFTPALPQLLRRAGIDSFFTTKLSWSETNRFPHDLFWWEGLDGSRVLTHCFLNDAPNTSGNMSGLGGYNGEPSPQALLAVWRNNRARLAHPESLFTMGYGDGGGGPTSDMAEDVRELAAFPALPELAYSRLDALFARLQGTAEHTRLPVWAGELVLELHRGTFTTQGRTKRLHRRAERDLVAAETAAAVCELLGGGRPPLDLGAAWRLLLRNQFHDILPGSSIAEVYTRADAELAEASAAAETAIAGALEGIAAVVAPPGNEPAALVLNPDLSPRPLRLVVPEPLPGAQPVAGGWALTGPTPVGGLEAVVVLGAEEPAAGARASGLRLENGYLRVELERDGTVASVLDKRAGREVLAGPGNQLWAYVDKPRSWDAWDVDPDYRDQGVPLGPPEAIEVVEQGPHRAAIELRWRWRASTVRQLVRLWANSPRLEFATELEWHDRRTLLKALFPLAVHARTASFETAFGVVERPTHRNTSWDEARFEVAGHRFADLSEPGYGAALLNDGRYGHHALGNELGLSLLRTPVYPDPHADEGHHTLTYALLPHLGSWVEGGVLAEAEDLNRPLPQLRCRAGAPARRRALGVEGMALGLAALKRPEDGDGLVLRVYEPRGARGEASLRLPDGWRAAAELNLLEDPTGEPDLRILPFQVRTYRLAGPG